MVKQYFLGIGINYLGTSNELRGCINDIENMLVLVKKLYPSVISFKLTDKTTIKPTRTNIINTLTQILSQMVLGDVLILHYSGHGTFIKSKTSKESDGQDEFIVPVDLQLIKDDELSNILYKNMKSGTKLFALFDSCHSGTVLDLRNSYDSPTNLIINNDGIDPKGQVISISGCLDTQTSADSYISGSFQGAMTNSFIKNFTPNQKVLLMVDKMKADLKKNGFPQVPLLSTSSNVNIDTNVFFNP